jgi:pSer/pThr/pTyr-binding forkhead associated (FHA) protein
MADVPVLMCTKGALEGEVFPIFDGQTLKIGRADDNDVVLLHDDGVSRYHASLLFDNGSLWLRDAGSRNGVFVNDKRLVDHRALSVGDRVRVGASEFTLRWQGDKRLEREVVEGAGGEAGQPARTRWRLWPFE